MDNNHRKLQRTVAKLIMASTGRRENHYTRGRPGTDTLLWSSSRLTMTRRLTMDSIEAERRAQRFEAGMMNISTSRICISCKILQSWQTTYYTQCIFLGDPAWRPLCRIFFALTAKLTAYVVVLAHCARLGSSRLVGPLVELDP